MPDNDAYVTVGPQVRLPSWADEWLKGNCGCGARLVSVSCMVGDRHTVCAKSGWDTNKCPGVRGL